MLDKDIEILKKTFVYHPDGYLLRVLKFGKPCTPYNPCNKKNSAGYHCVRVSKNKKVGLHVAIWAYHNNRWPTLEVDHIDRNKDNYKISNLREATPSQNRINTGIQIRNTSGVKNVNYHKSSGLWRVTYYKNNKHGHWGFFKTFEEAEVAAKDMREKIYNDR